MTRPEFDPDFIPEFLLRPNPTPEERVAIRERHRLEDLARLRARHAPYISAVRREAEESLRTQRWAWATRAIIQRAEWLLARGEDLDLDGAQRLAELTRKAALTVQRALEAATVPHEPELALASDSSVREAAREGVAYMTRLDADQAQDRNREGWSKSTSVMGHVLDTLETFSVSQASHALKILRIHRRQLAAPLAARLFDGAPELGL